MTLTHKLWMVLAIAIAAVVVDQFTKVLAFDLAPLGSAVPVLPGLDIATGYNSGIAFGLAAGAPPLVLIGIAFLVSILFLAMIVKSNSLPHVLGLATVIGGAAGNVIDRLRLGLVRDFIDLHAGEWHWPAFNMSDALVVIGLLLVMLVPERHRTRKHPRDPVARI